MLSSGAPLLKAVITEDQRPADIAPLLSAGFAQYPANAQTRCPAEVWQQRPIPSGYDICGRRTIDLVIASVWVIRSDA